MTRSVPEWKGKTDDTPVPPRVRQRVFDRAHGMCHYCSSLIVVPGMKWQCDHVKAIIDGGENRESNLAPIHAKVCHPAKTGAEVDRKKKVAAVRQKHIGVTQPKGKIQSPGFPKVTKEPKVTKASLPPRQLFARREP